MAATLTQGQEDLVHFSFPIEKQEETAAINPVDGTPDIWILGKATDGTIDGDREIVDPDWSAKALQEWVSTGGNVRMSHDPRRPVGKGHEVHVTTDGHWVKSLISDPLAKHFIRQKVLNDYSVGISNPDFRYRDPKLDPQGKALRIITGRPDGQSRVAELSICDRGSNFNSRFTMVKSAGGGFTGQMVGDEDEIAKATPSGLLTKMAHDDDFVNVDLPKGASISISPGDFAKLRTFKQELATKAAVPDAEKRDVSTAERRSLADSGDALPDGSYPIKNAGDLRNAAHLARTGHGDAEGAKRLIARRARELGVANPLDDDNASKGTVTETAEKAETPEVAAIPDATKETGPAPDAVKARKPKKGKKMPPWLKPGDDAKPDDDSSCKSVTDHLWTGVPGTSEIRCEKCRTTPAQAAGLTATHDMNCAPVGELLETPPPMSVKASPTPQSASGASEAAGMTPVPQHREPDGAIVEPFERDASLPAEGQGETPTRLEAGMMKSSPEVAAILRFKSAGIDIELGRLHDLTCPAFHPEDVAKCHPFADLAHTDEAYFQKKAVEAACGPDLGFAKSVQLAWQAARVLRETDPGVLNDYRLDAHKAFRDANPGPGSAPTPGMMAPGKYNRPLITDGHAATSGGHDGPNSGPAVATTSPDAHHFDRPPLASGHQSPSPSHMKAGFPYPGHGDGPTQLNYAVMEKERARQALMQMHEHLSRQFPEACPIDLDRPVTQPESRGVPVAVGKDTGPSLEKELTEGVHNGEISIGDAAAALKAETADDGQVMDAEVWKGFKKQRKKLGKKVLAGKLTVDEARARMGRQFAQKAADEPQEAVQKGAVSWSEGVTYQGPAITEIVKAAVRDALHVETVPLEAATIGSFDPSPAIEAAVTKAVTPLLEKIQAQDTKLAETQRVIDAIADQPDPSTAAFSGLAFNPLRNKAAGPAGVPSQAEIAERTQLMMMRTLQDKYNASSDPAEREAYYTTLSKMRGVGQ